MVSKSSISVSVALVSLLTLTLAPAAGGEPREELLTLRQAGRAYEGAPPTIPHWFDPMDARACLKCHQTGLDVGYARPAPITPHAAWETCQQCHVPRAAEDQEDIPNSLAGLGLTRGARRQDPGAPPVMPHSLFGRENCVACHGGPGTPSAIRTSHPERANCLQCHALDAKRQVQ